MSTNKQSAADRIKALTESNKAPVVENRKIVSSNETIQVEDRRKYNRGHPQSGRKPGGVSLQKRALKQLLAQHFQEEVLVQMVDKKTGKTVTVKKPRILIQAERLFNFGNATPGAVDLWFNRAVGKAPQPLVGEEEEDAIKVDLGIDRILDKVYGDEPEED